ncbi:heme A synthase [Maribacter algarum]|uniref:Heme A synthase n=1 Tax=Maribacter algarum (ex Zhang et al. 2020) TaxID=2578118 RepID=A0A5S3PGP0_9FLAO|nr:COX15/CtaA family protein [Maribacter algarum]TMM53267.1 heme A synthase [Maribacter algarum]
MQENFSKIAKISLVLVYLVIVAGAIVRVTGSGMGCPDWPKCFGYYIPPTDISEIQWTPNKDFKKGQIIIVNESLQVAVQDFESTLNYNQSNWEPYTKHEYATFNPWHTWIEYINRLVTVILGIPMLILFILSFWLYKKDKVITIVTVFTLFVLGIQAVLGKIVVDTNLKPTMISVHMLIALLIMAMLIYLIHRTSKQTTSVKYDKKLLVTLAIAFVASLFQIIMGIQVRQYVDFQIDVLGEGMQTQWLQNPTVSFYIHRSFSILVVFINSFLAYRIYKYSLGYNKINWVMIILLVEIISGMAMYYLDFPFASQPLHLVLASLLFGVQFYMILEALKAKRSLKTL